MVSVITLVASVEDTSHPTPRHPELDSGSLAN